VQAVDARSNCNVCYLQVEIVSAYPKAKNAHVAEKAIKDRERDAAQWVVKPTNTIELDCTPEMSEHWVCASDR